MNPLLHTLARCPPFSPSLLQTNTIFPAREICVLGIPRDSYCSIISIVITITPRNVARGCALSFRYGDTTYYSVWTCTCALCALMSHVENNARARGLLFSTTATIFFYFLLVFNRPFVVQSQTIRTWMYCCTIYRVQSHFVGGSLIISQRGV